MKGGKLFQLLKSLSPAEFKGLKKMVVSPIYNTNPTLGVLLGLLQPQYPDFDSSPRGKEKLFKRIWQDTSYDAYKLHRLFTQMTQLVEAYLLLLDQRQNDFDRKKRLMRIYGKRNLLSFFKKEAKNLREELDIFPFRDLEYYQDQIEVNESIYFHPLNDKYDLKDESLDRLIDSLDFYFVLAKMRYGISLKSRERILTKPGNWRFMEALNTTEDLGFIKESVLYKLYQQAFLLLEEGGLKNFATFENLLFENITLLGKDRKVLFFTGLNFINRQVNKGIAQYSHKALEWYQFGLHNGLLTEDGKMNEVTFGNIVVFGCREGAFEWTKNFMNAYQHLLKNALRADVVRYHLGLWHFYQKDFEAAFSTLLNYTFIPAYFLKSRLTAIRAVFEQFLKNKAYYDLLIHQIYAFEMAMKRSKAFSKAAKDPVLNCLIIIRSLAKSIWNHKANHTLFEKYLDEINTNKKIATRQWLIAKLKQLRMT